MRKTALSLVAFALLSACADTTPAAMVQQDRLEVFGVEDGDMLKLRAGPGTGFDTIVGLPNGTMVRVRNCSRVGGTRWCEAALDRAPGLRGYVSETYLRSPG
ncbi:SH3 domain-containing protein [Roseovarius sp. A21]|uniref:SH3 domain-containing protein n=1 Tax=Roseovarius bejariae TaxID=2576383 RepID=A0A844CSB6_9RHOB|nr:SH3 domain-containing protein [Roseovarius bejariae]MRU14126.1 SH3 domain-containing protein [Roseovarius bejariae]